MPALQVIVRVIDDCGRARVLHQELREREPEFNQDRQIRQMLVGAQIKFMGPELQRPAAYSQRRD